MGLTTDWIDSHRSREGIAINTKIAAAPDPHHQSHEIQSSCSMMPNLEIENLSNDLDCNYWNNFLAEVFRHADNAEVTISQDAYAIIEMFATRHCDIFCRYVKRHCVAFLKRMGQLIQSKNYLTQRWYMKLLHDLLLKPQFESVMTTFINDWENLKIVMKLLKHHSKIISMESFHLFQLFVFNPNKHPCIHIVLWNNKDNLIRFFNHFHSNSNDPDFEEDKKYLCLLLSQLEKPASCATEDPKGHDSATSAIHCS